MVLIDNDPAVCAGSLSLRGIEIAKLLFKLRQLRCPNHDRDMLRRVGATQVKNGALRLLHDLRDGSADSGYVIDEIMRVEGFNRRCVRGKAECRGQ